MAAPDDKFRVLRKLPEVRFEEELRGYSKSQVDRVLQGLAPLAEDVAALQQRLTEAEGRAAAAEARLLEVTTAAHTASESTPVAAAPAPAAVPPPSFDETLSKTLLLAQRTADQTVAEAQAQAAELLDRARTEAQALEAENAAARRVATAAVDEEKRALLEAAHADVQAKIATVEASLSETEGAQRDALVAEIGEHVAVRDQLVADIERLEGHLAQRRETIRAALTDIAMIFEDPSRFHSEMPPSANEVSAPDPSSGPVVLEIDGLDDLAPNNAVARPAQPAQPVQQRQAPVLGELDGMDAGEPTAAVPMVELLHDEADDQVAVPLAPTPSDTNGHSPSNPAKQPTAWEPDQPVAWEAVPAEVAGAGVVVDDAAPVSNPTDDLDRAFDDWSSDPLGSGADSGEVIVDQVPWNDEPAHSASASMPSVTPADFGFEEAGERPPSSLPERRRASEDSGRPAWADAVPEAESPQVLTQSEDPFLDELRRATGEDAETDVALERFLTDNPDDADRRSSWFGRRK